MTEAAAAFTFAIAPICLQGGHDIPLAREQLDSSGVGTTKRESGCYQMGRAVLHCGQSQHNLLKLAASYLASLTAVRVVQRAPRRSGDSGGCHLPW
jgi:hypothetical protein